MFCGEQLLCAYLRPAKIDGAPHAAALLKLLVTRLRSQWPEVKIVLRADSGFCRQPILNWCDRHRVQYVVGLARNSRLHALVADHETAMAEAYGHTGIKQRGFIELVYAGAYLEAHPPLCGATGVDCARHQSTLRGGQHPQR